MEDFRSGDEVQRAGLSRRARRTSISNHGFTMVRTRDWDQSRGCGLGWIRSGRIRDGCGAAREEPTRVGSEVGMGSRMGNSGN